MSSICGGSSSTTSLLAPDGSGAVAGELLSWRESGGQVLAVTLRLNCNWMLVAGLALNLTVRYGSGGSLSQSVVYTPPDRATCHSFQVRVVAVMYCTARPGVTHAHDLACYPTHNLKLLLAVKYLASLCRAAVVFCCSILILGHTMSIWYANGVPCA